MKKRYIFLLVGGGLFVAVLINRGFKALDKKVAKMGSEISNKSTPVAAPINRDSMQRAYTFLADKLIKIYEHNEVYADNELKDREFFVKGIIKRIAKDIVDEPFITLGTDDFYSVQCYFENGEPLHTLKPGAVITVKGVCKGKMMNVLMKNCRIVGNLD